MQKYPYEGQEEQASTSGRDELRNKEQLRVRVAAATRMYGEQAVLVMRNGSRACLRCFRELPTRDLQKVRSVDVVCQYCGTILTRSN